MVNFLKQNKFWFALGLLVIIAGATFGAVFLPSRGQSEELTHQVQSKAQKVSSYRSGAKAVNREWIENAKRQQELWQKELQEVDQLLSQRYQWLGGHFQDPDNPGQDQLLAPEMWLMVHADKVEEMQQLLKENFPDASSAMLPLGRHGPASSPSPVQMLQEETRYWVLQAIVEALGALNKGADEPVIDTLEDIAFAGEPERLLHPSHDSVFKPVAYQVRLTTTFPQVPGVLYSMLSARPGFYITSFSLRRASGKGERRAPAPAAGGAPSGGAPSGGVPSGGAPSGLPVGGVPSGGGRGGGAGMPAFVANLIRQQAQRGTAASAPGGQAAPRQSRPSRQAKPQAEQKKSEQEQKPARDLPENLVEVTIRGYVTDYVGPQGKGD